MHCLCFFFSDCSISDIVVLTHDRHMKISWKVSFGGRDPFWINLHFIQILNAFSSPTWKIAEKEFNCPRERLDLEIYMAPLAKPLLFKIPPDAEAYTVNSILPRSRGAVRLRAVTKMGEIKYSSFVDFYRPVLGESCVSRVRDEN